MEPDKPAPLVNRPDAKLPPILKGSRIQKRPLPGLSSVRRQSKNTSSSSNAPAGQNTPGFDLDGYRMPARAAHTTIIKVTANTPFMTVVKRARNALDTGPQNTKGLPLMARIAALGVRDSKGSSGNSGGGSKEESRGPVTDALDDVVLVATGKAIQKALEVAAFFMRNKQVKVLFRTRSIAAIDDVVAEDEDAEEEDQVRVRHVSCVEVGLRWRE